MLTSLSSRTLISTLLITQLLAPSLSATPLPLPTSPLTPRQDVCSNAPTTIAGTPLSARTLPLPLPPRRDASTIVWCTPGSSTYVRLRMLGPANAAVGGMLTTAYMIVTMLAGQHDGVIPASQAADAAWQWSAHQGLTLRTWNTNNHQMTYGVVGAAILALRQFMEQRGFGTVSFTVWDGVNEVGAGVLE